MTNKTITGAYAAGFTLTASFSALTIANSASVGGTGVFVTNIASVENDGLVEASIGINHWGVYLNAGGAVQNNSTITGFSGVRSTSTFGGVYAPGTVFNGGSIGGYEQGVELLGGGSLQNFGTITGGNDAVAVSGGYGRVINYGLIRTNTTGSLVSQGAGVNIGTGGVFNEGSIYGYVGVGASGSATITNLGTISGVFYGVSLTAGGLLQNGFESSDTSSRITSVNTGVSAAAASIVNFGVITGGPYGDCAVSLSAGSTLTNGAPMDRYALVEGYGGVITADAASAISNFGHIIGDGTQSGQAGVVLAGGTLTNGSPGVTSAVIEAYTAVTVTAGGMVANFGDIISAAVSAFTSGISFTAGGSLTNGSNGSHAALVEGYVAVNVTGAAGTIANFGTLAGAAGLNWAAVNLQAGGLVNNGGLLDASALISGYGGVDFGLAGTLNNFGAVKALDVGVQFTLAGNVVNGAATDQTALISGYVGVLGGSPTAVVNFGTIRGDSVSVGAIEVFSGASVTNGGGGDLAAQIIGGAGVQIGAGLGAGATGTVVNYATITGQSGPGVALYDGGRVVNGKGVVRSSLIQGSYGVVAFNAAASVVNSGIILGNGGAVTSAGVFLKAGGGLANGSINNTTALVEGYTGADLIGAGASVNFGTIWGAGDAASGGAYLNGGASLTNGAAGHAVGLIEGYAGVGLGAAGANTLTNFGTIEGVGGVAVNLGSAADALGVGAGSMFIGSVMGGGGTLDLASGTGTITSLLVGGAVKETGSTTTFAGFGALEVGVGASFMVAGNGAITAGQGLIVAGSLIESGALTSAGTLTTSGTLAGIGTLVITGGVDSFNTGASLTIAKVTQSGGTASFNGPAITVADVWTQTAGVITVPTGDRVNFTGTGDSFAGTLSGAGTVAFTGGTDAITGASLKATSEIINGAAVTLSGAITLSGALSATSTDLAIATAGVTLSGGGSLTLSNSAANAIKGVTATATLTNADKIAGAGTISGLVLVNQAAGSINGNQTIALTLDTGAATITNAGLIENVGTGGTTIASAINNTGTLMVTKGVLTAGAAVSGSGVVKIAGGVADFAAAFSENVAFTSATGVLELAKSQAYTGQVTGFSKTGTSSLDLLDIAFSGSTKASFSGTTASGVLTVTDGAHTSKITLLGNYTASTFNVSSDGHGGTSVVDPTAAPTGRTPPMLPLISAMAGFGARGGAGGSAPVFAAREASTILVRPA